MAMTPAARATAIYNKIAASPNFSKLSPTEKSALQAQIQSIWGDGDLVYIQTNADVSPSGSPATGGTGLENPSGQPVATTGGPTAQTGATTSPEPLIGTGSIL